MGCRCEVCRSTHLKVCSLLLACLVVYLYLYVNVAEVLRNTFTVGIENNSPNDPLSNGTNFSLIIWQLRNNSSQNQSVSNSKPDGIENKNSSKKADSIFDFRETLHNSIIQNKSKKLLTLFTTWVAKPSKYMVYNNTIKNWASLKPFARLVVFTNETDVASFCSSYGWDVLPITASSVGVPILKQMYIDVIAKFDSFFYAYSNGDILYTDDLVNTLLLLLGAFIPDDRAMLIVGVRTNVKNVSREESATFENITAVAKRRGKLFQVYAEDYFITTETYPWKDIPPVVIGRPAYDNWLVLNARKSGHITVDATRTVLAVHQTTKAGDYEGHSNKNRDFNPNLLAKLYKRVHYNAGGTSCCTFLTKYDDSHIPKLTKQEKIPKNCFPL